MRTRSGSSWYVVVSRPSCHAQYPPSATAPTTLPQANRWAPAAATRSPYVSTGIIATARPTRSVPNRTTGLRFPAARSPSSWCKCEHSSTVLVVKPTAVAKGATARARAIHARGVWWFRWFNALEKDEEEGIEGALEEAVIIAAANAVVAKGPKAAKHKGSPSPRYERRNGGPW